MHRNHICAQVQAWFRSETLSNLVQGQAQTSVPAASAGIGLSSCIAAQGGAASSLLSARRFLRRGGGPPLTAE